MWILCQETNDRVFSQFLKKLSSALEISGFKYRKLPPQELHCKKLLFLNISPNSEYIRDKVLEIMLRIVLHE